MAIETLEVKFTGNSSDLDNTVRGAESSVGRFSNVVSGMAMGAGIAVAGFAIEGGKALLQFGADSVEAASNLAETSSKIGVLFGESGDAIKTWSESSATAFGQSQVQAMDAAATFGVFGKSAGLAGTDLVDFSTEFVELASDMASFSNTTPEQAIVAIGAALRGESEPIRSYGVLLDDATLRQKALELGIIATTKDALTPQQKVLAAQAAIYEQTADAQGDFGRTSDGLANQQRILNAQMETLKSTIGTALLPVVLAFTSAMNDLVQRVLPPVAEFISQKLKPSMDAISQTLTSTVGPAIAAISNAFAGLGTTVQGQADGPLAYLKAWFDENMPRIMAIVQNVTQAIAQFWAQHGEQIMQTVNQYLTWLMRFWDTVMRTVLDIVTAALQLLTGDFEGAGNTLQAIVERWRVLIVDAFTAMWNSVVDTWRAIDWGGIGLNIIRGIGQGLVDAKQWLLDKAREIAQSVMEPFDWVWNFGSPSRTAAQEIGRPIVEGVGVGMQDALGQLTRGMNSSLGGMLGGMSAPALAASSSASAPISIVVNISGGGADVGAQARDGLLSALRSAGLR